LNPDRTSFAGLVIQGTSATLEAVEVEGFAAYGAALSDSVVAWDSGSVEQVAVAAILSEASSVSLVGVTVAAGLPTTDAALSLLQAGVVAASGSSVSLSNVTVADLPGVGVLTDASTLAATELQVTRMGRAGIWFQNGVAGGDGLPALNLDHVAVTETTGIGLRCLRCSDLTLADATVDGLRPSVGVGEDLSRVTTSDGLQLVDFGGSMELVRVKLAGAERVSLLLDQATSDAEGQVRFDSVSLEPVAEALGLVSQSYTADVTGLDRTAAVAARDEAFAVSGAVLTVDRAVLSLPPYGPTPLGDDP
jgi:hypothetical protein